MGRLRILSFQPARSFEEALRAFSFYCESKNLSPQTSDWYSRRLRAFLDWARNRELLPEKVDAQHLREYLLSLTHKPPTVNGYLRALRAFFSYLHREGCLPQNPAKGLEPQRELRAVFPTFSPEQLRKLLSACNRKTFCGLRDYTLILLFADTGLRVSEVLGLRFQDIDLGEGLLLVNGKGRKQRQVPMGAQLKREFWRYLAARGDLAGQDLVFVSRTGERLSRTDCAKALRRLGRKAKLQGVRVSPHTFRYTFATMWLRSGGDLFTLQRILGHSSLEMVRRYAQQVVTDLQDKHRIHSPVDRLVRR
jgi:integrase/recombinase XerD